MNSRKTPLRQQRIATRGAPLCLALSCALLLTDPATTVVLRLPALCEMTLEQLLDIRVLHTVGASPYGDSLLDLRAAQNRQMPITLASRRE